MYMYVFTYVYSIQGLQYGRTHNSGVKFTLTIIYWWQTMLTNTWFTRTPKTSSSRWLESSLCEKELVLKLVIHVYTNIYVCIYIYMHIYTSKKMEKKIQAS